jgi:UDP-3-O-acyl N-acetylglucosamine deacetylase
MNSRKRQQTISREVACEGVGLHTGESATLTVRPAPPDHGVTFLRTDIAGAAPLSTTDLAPGADMRSALKNDTADLLTVEHFLAAMMAAGLDNLEVHIDGPEVPGLDGSSQGFLDMVDGGGIEEQDAPASEWIVESAVTVRNESGAMFAFPHDGFRVSYTLFYPQSVHAQGHGSFEITGESFRRELAGCRTFVMRAMVEAARAAGHGRGATTQNTLVLDDDGPFENELRFPDEPLRHKVLDIVGDLALMGAPLRGHVVGVASGHGLNQSLAAALRTAAKRVPVN